jgi:hypothetical protein
MYANLKMPPTDPNTPMSAPTTTLQQDNDIKEHHTPYPTIHLIILYIILVLFCFIIIVLFRHLRAAWIENLAIFRRLKAMDNCAAELGSCKWLYFNCSSGKKGGRESEAGWAGRQ